VLLKRQTPPPIHCDNQAISLVEQCLGFREFFFLAATEMFEGNAAAFLTLYLFLFLLILTLMTYTGAQLAFMPCEAKS